MSALTSNRKLRILLAAISLFLLIDLIQDTYAKYISSTSASGDFSIARWAFLVNEQDILNSQSVSNIIVPTIDSNDHIKDDVIAPTSTGSFEIKIDSSEVDVSFDQQISVSKAATNTVGDIIFTGYKKNNGSVIPINTPNSFTLNETHLLSDVNNENTYTFYIEWKDGTGETMNNAADTQASKNGIARVSVNLNFIQRATNVTPTPTPTPTPTVTPEP